MDAFNMIICSPRIPYVYTILCHSRRFFQSQRDSMSLSQYKHPAQQSKTPSAKALFALKEEILSDWLERVKSEIVTAVTLNSPIVINTIPLFLDCLAEALCEECSREIATESSNMAQEHGSERARITRYGPEQIIQEYQILRDVVRDRVRAAVPLTSRDEVTLQKSFDKAIQQSMISYFLVHGRIREQFIATLTHDLRNPIGVVKLAAELIGDAADDIQSASTLTDIKDLSVRIIKNAKRADRMIQEMLDATVMQIGERVTIKISACDVQDIVLAAVEEFSEQKSNRLKIELQSVKGYWDLDAFQRSIENLINNAFKYGDDLKPISIKIETSHERVMVSVHNYGNPIPVENLESLFQVFRRTDSARNSGKQGWGIGLALARSTAEGLGGSLGVDSSIERGTTFTIDVPCDARPFINSPTSVG